MRTATRWAGSALALTAALALGGCFANPFDGAIENIINDNIERSIEEQLGEDVEISVPGSGGSSLPSGWPSDVPTPEGEVQFSLGTPGNWSATILVSDESVIDRVYADLEAAGYSLTAETDLGGFRSRVYENDVYGVTVAIIPQEDGASGVAVQYTIIERQP